MRIRGVGIAVSAAMLMSVSAMAAALVQVTIDGQLVSVKEARAFVAFETTESETTDGQGQPITVIVPTEKRYRVEILTPAPIPELDADLARDAASGAFDVVLPDGTSFEGCIVSGLERSITGKVGSIDTKYSLACLDLIP